MDKENVTEPGPKIEIEYGLIDVVVSVVCATG